VNKLLSLLSPSLVALGMACILGGGEKMGDEASGSVNTGSFMNLRCQCN
jgi:hypothetical protein